MTRRSKLDEILARLRHLEEARATTPIIAAALVSLDAGGNPVLTSASGVTAVAAGPDPESWLLTVPRATVGDVALVAQAGFTSSGRRPPEGASTAPSASVTSNGTVRVDVFGLPSLPGLFFSVIIVRPSEV
jgi:hypothetical protein